MTLTHIFLNLFSFKFIYNEVQSIIIEINNLGCVFYGFKRQYNKSTIINPSRLERFDSERPSILFYKKTLSTQWISQKSIKKFEGKPGESAYFRVMLFRVTLMGVFDGGLSSRGLEEQVNTNIAYMYLAGMQKPDFRTFARFKEQNRDLINQAFIKSIKMAKEENLVKIHKIGFDETKIKAKSSLNNITDKAQLKILEENLKRSIELDEQENELFGDESGNSAPQFNDQQKRIPKNR